MQRWIERQRKIFDFSLSSLLRRKGKNIALFFVFTLVVFLPASLLFFVNSLKKEAKIILKETPEIIIQRVIGGRHELIPTGYIDKIRDITGVRQVWARFWGYYYDPVVGANYTLLVSKDSSLSGGNIIVGKGIAQARLALPGDTLEFRAFDGTILEFAVKDLFSAESALVTSDLVLIGENDFKRLFGVRPGLATDLVLNVMDPKDTKTIASRIEKTLPDTRQIVRDEILRTYEAIFDWRAGLMRVVLACTLLAYLILFWEKASGVGAEEKREIGILKALGWETSDILLLRFWESTVIALSAFFAGTELAYLHVYMGSAMLFSPVIKGWSVLHLNFKLVPFVDFSQISVLFLLSVVPYVVSSIVPSWRTATSDPDSVIR